MNSNPPLQSVANPLDRPKLLVAPMSNPSKIYEHLLVVVITCELYFIIIVETNDLFSCYQNS